MYGAYRDEDAGAYRRDQLREDQEREAIEVKRTKTGARKNSNTTERFVLRTVCGDVLVSTVGPLIVGGMSYDIGFGRSHETMIFAWDGEKVTNWGELDFAGYTSEDAARKGHEAMVEKYTDRGAPVAIGTEVQL